MSALVADEKKELDAAVKAGRITQAQADAFLANAKQRVTDAVNGTRPRGCTAASVARRMASVVRPVHCAADRTGKAPQSDLSTARPGTSPAARRCLLASREARRLWPDGWAAGRSVGVASIG